MGSEDSEENQDRKDCQPINGKNEDTSRRRETNFPLRKVGSEPSLSSWSGSGARPKQRRGNTRHQRSKRRQTTMIEPSGIHPVDVDEVGTRNPAMAVAEILSSGSSSDSSPQLARSMTTPAHKRHMRTDTMTGSTPLPKSGSTPEISKSKKSSIKKEKDGKERVKMIQDQSMDWQLTKESLADRTSYLLETGIWSDCEFMVGLTPNVKNFRAHKMILGMASPVFEAMFFGGLGGDNEDSIKILDVQPDAFHVMLRYVYTDNIKLNSFELVCDVCYAAKKYMLPALVEECTKYLWRDLYPRNACRAYEFANLFEESVLMEKGLQIIRTQTREILSETTFEDVEHSTLVVILSQDSINADESCLFDAMVRWADKECERQGIEKTGEKKRVVLKDALFLIRYLTFAPAEFAAGPARSDLLTQEESFAILMNISAPGSWDLPDYLSKEREPRKIPRELLPATDVDMSTKYWCKRSMLQEPHCLNTSILDCSVTFTVDKDTCIHGIEVPSQASELPPRAAAAAAQEPASQDLASLNLNGNEYNELLYAHLLDADGSRLTYTHFTAKVARDSMIEINFNRSVYIKANKVYRVGMVLNKVGWYPMGVCTRRVNCEGCFFTFCVGQPTDTQRDGLIRSIIFSK